ncbi:hypothetical protein H7J08_19245 [Mycobacterium frederiksbergense]|uniref:hypothetical protein n=1 Tax=Mycolicibacterium frederiksbergense TaxID=117567 RepID=UPI0021F354D6|nr:hypothetical protein [Mycolicibacterium frederiksbergense]MCV7046784.1 hypothetical protein [Mycolicibacterium frederiksbergense]
MSVTWRGVELLGVVSVLAGCATDDPVAPPSTSSAVAEPTKSQSPFQTRDGVAWLSAACGSPSVGDASPNSWLPGADPVALCITPPGRDGVLVGVYEDPAAAASDVGTIGVEHGYATRTDDHGRTWVFVAVESPGSAPLASLERFGFELS